MPSNIITITIPTKCRRTKLAACLRSIDYKDTRVFIGSASTDDKIFNADDSLLVIDFQTEQTDQHPVSVQNFLASKADADSHILPISDDIIFEPGAIQAAVHELNSVFPDSDGVIGFDIRNMKPQDNSPYAYMLIGSKFFNERLNRNLFNPAYYHFYADTELGEHANKIGKFRSCPEAGIIHFHPSAGYIPDNTHLAGRQEKWLHDYNIFKNRQQQ